MPLKELLKPDWKKILFFFLLLIPLGSIFVPVIGLPLALISKLFKIKLPDYVLIILILIIFLPLLYYWACKIGASVKSKKNIITYCVIFVFLSLVMGIFVVPMFLPKMTIRDSPAPGCIIRTGGPTFGGCNGKTIITNVNFDAPSCFGAKASNCNGGVLEIFNRCKESVWLGDLEVLPLTNVRSFPTIEFIKDETGNIKAQYTEGNYASYIPEQNETLSITGRIGEQQITISYMKSKKLC